MSMSYAVMACTLAGPALLAGIYLSERIIRRRALDEALLRPGTVERAVITGPTYRAEQQLRVTFQGRDPVTIAEGPAVVKVVVRLRAAGIRVD